MLAARRSVVTVEEIVDKLDAPPNAVVLPSWVVGAVSEVTGGAFPSYAHGYYPRNNAFYKAWDNIARERETLSGLDGAACAEHARFLRSSSAAWRPQRAGDVQQCLTAAYTADEMMTIAAARKLPNGAVCFVGIGLPSAAANVARLTHAPDVVLIYESGPIGCKPSVLPLSIGDGELSETADTVVSIPEMFSLLASGRAHRRGIPGRGADRPLRQHQHHCHRRLRKAHGSACPERAELPRSPRRPRKC